MRYVFGFLCVCALGVMPWLGAVRQLAMVETLALQEAAERLAMVARRATAEPVA